MINFTVDVAFASIRGTKIYLKENQELLISTAGDLGQETEHLHR